jgi:ankyrin repeat protein
MLLKAGADVNASPAYIEGRTALEGAAENGRLDLVQLLLNAGVGTTT